MLSSSGLEYFAKIHPKVDAYLSGIKGDQRRLGHICLRRTQRVFNTASRFELGSLCLQRANSLSDSPVCDSVCTNCKSII